MQVIRTTRRSVFSYVMNALAGIGALTFFLCVSAAVLGWFA